LRILRKALNLLALTSNNPEGKKAQTMVADNAQVGGPNFLFRTVLQFQEIGKWSYLLKSGRHKKALRLKKFEKSYIRRYL